MTKMEQYCCALAVAFELGKEIEGIDKIDYHLRTTGTPEARRQLCEMVYYAMKKAGLDEVKKGEVA